MNTPASPTRRQFLSRTSTGLGAALLVAQAPGILSVGRAADSGRKINFALAGLGSLSTNQIAPALQKTKHARLAGIITGTPAKAEAWKAKYGIPDKNIYNYDTMVNLKDNPDIDVVYVVTPNGLHKEHTIKAAQAGKHVLCEKPMANTAKDCQAMINACKQARVKLAIGYRCQFTPQHQECIRIAREKEMGAIKIIEAGFGFRIGDPNQWRLRADLAGGGALMDVGVSALQACRYLVGEEPKLVSAIEIKTDPVKFAEVDESLTWQMTFPSGVIAYCSTSYNVNGINRFTAYADQGWFGMDPAYSYSGIKVKTSKGEREFEQVDHFAAEMDDFARCIIENRESRVAGVEGLRDMVVIEGIYKSIKTGRTVKLG
ncbi:MAG TPA: glucose-fructose oxidoreductase [Verrucomicrobiales bacterium]|nr:glucose-fructose oxidoreductase [Verrucomicrobiales bacterium]